MDVIVPPKTCLVCLRKLRKCELGKPEDCDHLFCFSCLYEWSKVMDGEPRHRIAMADLTLCACVFRM